MEKYFELIVEVRGLGLMIGVEMDREANANKVVQDAFKNGLLIMPCGDKSIRIAPPLIIDEGLADRGIDIFEKCLKLCSTE